MAVEEKAKRISSISELANATFAVAEGMVIGEMVLSRLPHARIRYYKTIMDCFNAVKNGEVDSAVYDEPLLRYILAHSSELYMVEEKFSEVDFGFAVNLNRPDLKKAIDDTLAELKSNGIYEDMKKRWFPKTGAIGLMPNIKLSGENGILKFGTTPVDRPFSFIVGDNVNTGFDIELAKRICQKLKMDIEFHNLVFSELIPSLLSGKIDMFGSIYITEERRKKILFSEPYFHGGVAAIVKK